jgi:sugar phosphate permease
MDTSMTVEQQLKYWRKRVFISLWFTYASFYLCRVNMSVALPGIMEEFGLSKTSMGWVLTAIFFAYAIGQFINGQLGDKVGARKLISLGVLASAGLNVLFAFLPGIVTLMLIVWGLNGYFQSMGWSPSVKTMANWFPLENRGKISGLFGSCYQFGNAASWALAGFVIGALGWRWGFWIPAIVFAIMGAQWLINGRNAPEEVGLPTIEEESEGIMDEVGKSRKDEHLGFIFTIKTVTTDPHIWIVALSLFGLNMIRYGFMDWAPTYMFEVEGAKISHAAYKAIAMPLAGSLGALFAGWSSDRFFQSRRAPIMVIMLFCLSVSSFVYPKFAQFHWVYSLMCLMAIGFFIYGPHVMICATISMDYGSRKAAASTAGFIDGFGYFGASITGVLSGYLIDNISWNAAFWLWIGGALLAMVLMSFLWNYKPQKGKYH